MLVKLFGQTEESQRRYNPPQIVGTETVCCTGKPSPKHISTSFAERQNLMMQTSLRRVTRLTNASSKKVENYVHALSIYFMHYNFVRIHQTTRIIPAMVAGVTSKLWGLEGIMSVVNERESKQKGTEQ